RADDAVYTVVVPAPAPAEAPPPPPPPPKTPAGPSAQRIGAIATLGAAAIALGAGTYFGVRSMSLHANVKSVCPDYPRCPDDVASLNSDATRAGTMSTVAFVAGGVLAATGVVLFVTAPKSGPRVGARVGAGSAFVEGAW